MTHIRRFLQIAVTVFSFVPIGTGLYGMLFGPEMIMSHGGAGIDMDSHFRYLSGLLTGIGLGFLSCVPRIENKTQCFQLLVGIVVLGGLGRLYSLITAGAPGDGMAFGLIMELLITPLLGVLQLYSATKQKPPGNES